MILHDDGPFLLAESPKKTLRAHEIAALAKGAVGEPQVYDQVWEWAQTAREGESIQGGNLMVVKLAGTPSALLESMDSKTFGWFFLSDDFTVHEATTQTEKEFVDCLGDLLHGFYATTQEYKEFARSVVEWARKAKLGEKHSFTDGVVYRQS